MTGESRRLSVSVAGRVELRDNLRDSPVTAAIRLGITIAADRGRDGRVAEVVCQLDATGDADRQPPATRPSRRPTAAIVIPRRIAAVTGESRRLSVSVAGRVELTDNLRDLPVTAAIRLGITIAADRGRDGRVAEVVCQRRLVASS